MRKIKQEFHGFQGLTFGAIDAIINVLGIVIGLSVITNRQVVLMGLLISGIANSLGNAVGFHVSEEAEGIHTRKEVWKATIMSGSGTFVFTLILLMPLLLMEFQTALVITVAIGIELVVLLSVTIGKKLKYNSMETAKLSLEYVSICIAVILISFSISSLINSFIS